MNAIFEIEKAKSAKYLAVDTEGNGRDVRVDPQAVTLGVSYAFRGQTDIIISNYLPINHQEYNIDGTTLLALQDLLEDENGPALIFHNAKHDIAALKLLHIDIAHRTYYDTMLMAHWINENLPNKSLDYVSKHYGGQPKNKSELFEKIAKGFGWDNIPIPLMKEYSSHDAFITLELFEKLYHKFEKQGFDSKLWEVERQFIDLVMKMEKLGITINTELCKKEVYYGSVIMEDIRTELQCNPSSPKALEKLLHQELKIPVKFTTPNGKPSFDKHAMEHYEEQLQQMNNQTAELVLEYRGWQKTISSNYKAYLDLLGPDGRLRPNYKLHGARTGRLSCEKPNLQQIPRVSSNQWNGELKKAFIPSPSYKLWEADYSQLELRLAAIYSKDDNLLEAFHEGQNVFTSMSNRLGWSRQDCKTFTYAVLYGGGKIRISNLFSINELEAIQMIREFFNIYPGLREISKRAEKLCSSQRYVNLWTGRRRHFENARQEKHKAFNAIIQGGAAEIVKRKGIELGKKIDWEKCKILLQIHDSYVFEVEEGLYGLEWLTRIKAIMEDMITLDERLTICPFKVDIHPWGE